ncbi:Retrovirus-related Pol polyprotein from transposon 412 [Eumeta japonica]|uniref:Retrovirus-related Pol polyprotein from transposon 412 n=1 Tax=Eumeta variegata TaxID=151549 RepID=A0A4C1TKL5_EUMVA|nr:Retrovirus-related Pol polyprotein from transposon 412 [Eumeta japonica]
MHDEPWTGGHFGLTKTLAMLKESYFVKNTEKEVEKYIGSCRICLKCNKVSNKARLQPIIVQGLIEKNGVDVVGPIRRPMHVHKYIITTIEYATKYVAIEVVLRRTSSYETLFREDSVTVLRSFVQTAKLDVEMDLHPSIIACALRCAIRASSEV